MLRKDGNLIFVVCLERVLWFLFLLWNLYCGFIEQNDNEIQIFFFFFFPCHPGLFLWWVCPRNIYSIRYGLTDKRDKKSLDEHSSERATQEVAD